MAPRIRLTDLPARVRAQISEQLPRQRRSQARSAKSKPNETLALQIRTSPVVPVPTREFFFCPGRRWRADFAWPAERLIVEVEGGTWLPGGGRHNRGRGFEEDCRKYLAAFQLGFMLVRFTTAMVDDLTALKALEEFFRERANRFRESS